jgi:D-alanyl-lipoteichoic acid acyltransferase DltB (MBOAT superfamily)
LCRIYGNRRLAELWLVLASLTFYGYWDVSFLGLLIISILLNFLVAKAIRAQRAEDKDGVALLVIGVTANLGVLAIFKYSGFLIDNVASVLGASWTIPHLILPLAISFFTFQQIAYLVDTRRQNSDDSPLLTYMLFITFFPQLIAGPIVHHREMMPQFAKDNGFKLSSTNLAIGLSVFILGLFKKVVLADSIAPTADAVFGAADSGIQPTFLEAWVGALAFTFQLYFDFSGYSDMALGLARMFGIKLPVNFFSPYRATSIIEFWHRWHMTLSRFLRDYVYFPLGGGRQGEARRHTNLMLTMLIGGLWHGAAWTFVAWGAIHGMLLFINHLWRRFFPPRERKQGLITILICWCLTFLSVTVAWVCFRAESFDGAITIMYAMIGGNGIQVPLTYQALLGPLGPYVSAAGIQFVSIDAMPLYNGISQISHLLSLLLIVILAPNSVEFFSRFPVSVARTTVGISGPTWLFGLQRRVAWRPVMFWAIVSAALMTASLLSLSDSADFLYYQF